MTENFGRGRVGGGAGTGFQHSLVPCGDRVIGDRAGITASLRVRECMSTADRVGSVVLVAGEAKCRRHDEPSDHVGET